MEKIRKNIAVSLLTVMIMAVLSACGEEKAETTIDNGLHDSPTEAAATMPRTEETKETAKETEAEAETEPEETTMAEYEGEWEGWASGKEPMYHRDSHRHNVAFADYKEDETGDQIFISMDFTAKSFKDIGITSVCLPSCFYDDMVHVINMTPEEYAACADRKTFLDGVSYSVPKYGADLYELTPGRSAYYCISNGAGVLAARNVKATFKNKVPTIEEIKALFPRGDFEPVGEVLVDLDAHGEVIYHCKSVNKYDDGFGEAGSIFICPLMDKTYTILGIYFVYKWDEEYEEGMDARTEAFWKGLTLYVMRSLIINQDLK